MESLIQKYLRKHKKTGKNGMEYSISCYKGEYVIDWKIKKPKKPSFTKEEIEEEKREQATIILKKKLINPRQNYLKMTDWYIIRFVETKQEPPKIIRKKRACAREEINLIENETDIQDLLDNYSINF